MSDSGRFFLDTNVFVYAFDPTAPAKQKRAHELVARALRDGRGAISYQVVQEFCAVASRKFADPLTPADLVRYLQGVLAPLCEIHSSVALCEKALRIREDTGYSFYDSLVMAAAVRLSCDVLYTEDLQDGRVIERVRIINPFAD